jgi:hypothetical protein
MARRSVQLACSFGSVVQHVADYLTGDHLPHRGTLIVEVHPTLDVSWRAGRSPIGLAFRVIVGVDGSRFRLRLRSLLGFVLRAGSTER